MAFFKPALLSAEAAETLAIQALAFIAQDQERLGRFLAITGMGPEEIRAAAGKRHFLAGLLDYVAGDEALLVQFAEQVQVDPAAVGMARRALSEGSGEGGRE